MKTITSCSFTSPYGSTILSLAVGDILKEATPEDIIVASVAGSSYDTVNFPRTLIAGIEREYDVDFSVAMRKSSFDLRRGLSTWAIVERGMPIVLLIEFTYPVQMEETFLDLTLALEILARKHNVPPQARVLMPILGSGAQRFKVESMAPELLRAADRALTRMIGATEIVILDLSDEKIGAIARVWNQYLGRSSCVRADSGRSQGLIQEISQHIHLMGMAGRQRYRWIEEFCILSRQQQLSSDTLPALCRQIAESVVKDFWARIDPKRRPRGLADDIEDLKNYGLAHWIIGYLHTLRQFGNYGSHLQQQATIFPSQMEENDLALCLQCLNAILPVWQQWRAV
jgi:hypothetical protein